MMTYEQWEKKNREQRIFKKVLNAVFMTVLVLALLVISTVALCRVLDTPEVEFSWETKKCVRVVYMNGRITDCSVLPDRYDHVWVK